MRRARNTETCRVIPWKLYFYRGASIVDDDIPVPIPRQERFSEFCRRIQRAPPSRSFTDAYNQICHILDAVEDELTAIPFNSDNWQTDGRMYPPQLDSVREVEGHPEIKRFRSRAHNTFIGANGSIEIQVVSSKEVILSKAGEDGRGVWEQ